MRIRDCTLYVFKVKWETTNKDSQWKIMYLEISELIYPKPGDEHKRLRQIEKEMSLLFKNFLWDFSNIRGIFQF